jgi:hypothetical protein
MRGALVEVLAAPVRDAAELRRSTVRQRQAHGPRTVVVGEAHDHGGHDTWQARDLAADHLGRGFGRGERGEMCERVGDQRPLVGMADGHQREGTILADVEPDAPKVHPLESVDRELRDQERDVRVADRQELGGLNGGIGRQRRRISRAAECGDVGRPDVGVGLAEPVGAHVVVELLQELSVRVQVAAGRVLDEREHGRRRHKSIEDGRGAFGRPCLAPRSRLDGGDPPRSGTARQPRVEQRHGCVGRAAGQAKPRSDARFTLILASIASAGSLRPWSDLTLPWGGRAPT